MNKHLSERSHYGKASTFESSQRSRQERVVREMSSDKKSLRETSSRRRRRGEVVAEKSSLRSCGKVVSGKYSRESPIGKVRLGRHLGKVLSGQ